MLLYNVGCFKKRHLYTTKVSCYLQSAGISFVLCSKINKNVYQKKCIKKIHQVMKSKT